MLGVWRGEKKDQALFAWRIVVRVNRIPNGAARGFRSPRDSTMNGHGGKRPGAGRPKGAASRANEQVRQEAAGNRRAAARLHAADHARSEPAGSGLSLRALERRPRLPGAGGHESRHRRGSDSLASPAASGIRIEQNILVETHRLTSSLSCLLCHPNAEAAQLVIFDELDSSVFECGLNFDQS